MTWLDAYAADFYEPFCTVPATACPLLDREISPLSFPVDPST
jgi:hypothetical protein